MSVIDDFVAAAAESRAAWADSVIREMIAHGTALSRVSLQEHPDGITRICLDHHPVSEWKVMCMGRPYGAD